VTPWPATAANAAISTATATQASTVRWPTKPSCPPVRGSEIPSTAIPTRIAPSQIV
jgi:hypothetical protein